MQVSDIGYSYYANLRSQMNYRERLVESNKDNHPLHMVLYTDGGFRQNPNMAGFGIHGYIHTNQEAKQGSGCKDAHPTAAGYFKKTTENVKPVTVLAYLDYMGPLHHGTNNTAELEALLIGLLCACENKVAKVTFRMDSEYALKGASERIHRMRQLEFISPQTQAPIPNYDHWRMISDLLKEAESLGIEISWSWVKGHSDSVGNNKADVLATRGIVMGRNDAACQPELLLRPAKSYWNAAASFNRFLQESRWYFTTHRKPDESGWHSYYVGASKDEDENFGSPQSDCIYGIIRVKEKDPVLAMLEEHVNTFTDQAHRIMMGRLDFIFNPTHYNDILNGGLGFLYRKLPRIDLYIADKTPVVLEMDPPRKGYAAAMTFNNLEMVLDAALKGDQPEAYTINDITSQIYETVAPAEGSKKKPIKRIQQHIDTSLSELKIGLLSPINTNPVETVLSLGIDTPRRNLLAAIAEEEPKVWVVTWKESDIAFRYATVVISEGAIGIWASPFSNLRLL